MSFKGVSKEELMIVADELGLEVPDNPQLLDLKKLIETSEIFKSDKEFCQDVVQMVQDTKRDRTEQEKIKSEYEKVKLERLKKEFELIMAKSNIPFSHMETVDSESCNIEHLNIDNIRLKKELIKLTKEIELQEKIVIDVESEKRHVLKELFSEREAYQKLPEEHEQLKHQCEFLQNESLRSAVLIITAVALENVIELGEKNVGFRSISTDQQNLETLETNISLMPEEFRYFEAETQGLGLESKNSESAVISKDILINSQSSPKKNDKMMPNIPSHFGSTVPDLNDGGQFSENWDGHIKHLDNINCKIKTQSTHLKGKT